MGVYRGRIHEWYIGVKVQACATWSSAKGTESPDLAMYCSNQAYLHASSFVLHLHSSWRIGESWFVAVGLSNRSVVSCLLEPSLPRNNRLAHHPTTLTSDEVRHVTSDIPLVAVGPFLLPRSAPTYPPVSHQTREQTARNSHTAGIFCPTKCHGSSSKLRSTLYQTAEDLASLLWRRRWNCTSRKEVWLEEDICQGEEGPLAVLWITKKESALDWSILTTLLQESPLVSLLEFF